MPIYTYTNNQGESVDRFFHHASKPESFTEDGVEYQFDFAATVGSVGTTSSEGWPRASRSAGVGLHPGAREAAFKADRANGVPTETDAKGHRIFESPGHQRRWLKANGWVNLD